MKKLLMLIALLLLSSTVSSAQQRLPVFNSEILSVTIGSDERFNNAYTAEWGMNGEFIAVAYDHGVLIYNAFLELQTNFRIDRSISSLSWRAQTNQLAIGFGDGVEVWEYNPSTRQAQLVNTIPLVGYITYVSYSPDGNYLAVFEADMPDEVTLEYEFYNYIRFYDTNTWQMVSQVTDWVYLVDNNKAHHSNCDWRSDGLVLACFGFIVDAPTRKHSVTTKNQNMVHLFDPQTGALLKSIPNVGVAQDIAISWRPNSSLVALGTDTGIHIVDVDAPEADAFVAGLGGPFIPFVSSVDWSPDGKYILSHAELLNYELGQIIGTYAPYDDNRVAILSRWNPFENQVLTLYLNRTTGFTELAIDNVSLIPGIALTLMPTATPFSVPTPKP